MRGQASFACAGHRRLAQKLRTGRSVPSLPHNSLANLTQVCPFIGAVASKLGHRRAQGA